MNAEIEKFIKENYDNVRSAYEFDNVARKKVIEAFKVSFQLKAADWELVSAHIRMEWEALKEVLDPMIPIRNALLPVVEMLGTWMGDNAFSGTCAGSSVQRAQHRLKEFNRDVSREKMIRILTEAGAHILMAIEKLQAEK